MTFPAPLVGEVFVGGGRRYLTTSYRRSSGGEAVGADYPVANGEDAVAPR